MATEPISKTSSPRLYPEMIMGAIDALNKKEGSNKSSIRKHIEATYGDLPVGHTNSLTEQLNKLKEDGELVLVKNNFMRPGPNAPPKRGRGRPPKAKDLNAPETHVGALATLTVMPTTVKTDGPSRGRGRPRKVQNAPPKRGRGRPRKAKDLNAPKTHVDAPSALIVAPIDVTTSVPTLSKRTNGPSKGRGRPRKDHNSPPSAKKAKIEKFEEPTLSKSGRPRGRPRKVPRPLAQNGGEAN